MPDPNLGGLIPGVPDIPIVVQSPIAQFEQEAKTAEVKARGQTIYLGELEMGWVTSILAWFRSR